MTVRPLALGLDPGLAHCGIALVELYPDSLDVVDLDCFATQKHDGKHDVYAADDNLRRARELAARLGLVFDRHRDRIVIVCAEAMSHPMFVNRQSGQRNVLASVVGQLSMAWGVVAAYVQQRGLPLVQAPPQALKKAVCGDRSASKEDVRAAIDTLFGVDLAAMFLKPKKLRKADYEHPFDALAAVFATRESEVFRLARRGTMAHELPAQPPAPRPGVGVDAVPRADGGAVADHPGGADLEPLGEV